MRQFSSLLLTTQGDIHRASERADDAERSYQRAVEIARSQSAKLWEIHAAVGLAQLWHGHGKTNEARDFLTPIYGWFTEGFDTADLKEAKALLDELG